MIFDFTNEQEQSEAGIGGGDFQPTPPGSIVKVRVELDDAGQYAVQGQHPSISSTQSGIWQINFKLTRLSNGDVMRFQRVTLLLDGQPNKDRLDNGQKGLCHIGGAILKTMLTVGGRGMASELEAFNGIECAVMLNGEWSKPNAEGKTFWNDKIYNPIENSKTGLGPIAVLDPSHELFQQVMSGTDYISDRPIPERPEPPIGAVSPNAQPWNQNSANPQHTAPAYGNQPQQQSQNCAEPGWFSQGVGQPQQQQTRQQFNGGGNGPGGTEDVPF